METATHILAWAALILYSAGRYFDVIEKYHEFKLGDACRKLPEHPFYEDGLE